MFITPSKSIDPKTLNITDLLKSHEKELFIATEILKNAQTDYKSLFDVFLKENRFHNIEPIFSLSLKEGSTLLIHFYPFTITNGFVVLEDKFLNESITVDLNKLKNPIIDKLKECDNE